MKNKFLFAVVIILLIGCSNEKYYNEWVENNGKYSYYNNSGEKLKNTNIMLEGKTYYFDKNGNMLTGWNDFGYEKRHFDSDGAMNIGWKEIDNKWYLFNEDGLMNKGWGIDGDNWYYFGTDGIMQKQKWIDNDYYVDDTGNMLKGGWNEVDGEMYFFDINGKIDRNKDFKEELKSYYNERRQEKENERKRTLTYEDHYGVHTINFILPELPAKRYGSHAIMNSIDIKYALNRNGNEFNGIYVYIICEGTKESGDYYPHPCFKGNTEIGQFTCFEVYGDNGFYGKTTFRSISKELFLRPIKKDITIELELISL